MKYTIREINTVLNGSFLHSGQLESIVTQLLTDSRRLGSARGVLFFAIKGQRNDGHRYLGNLYRAGVRNFIVSEPIEDLENYQEANIVRVKDTLAALQTLAAHHRHRFSQTQVIGITGSNGKTIVKEWLFQLLHRDFSIVRSPKSYNSQIGVPLSVWSLQSRHNLAIFEAGISQMNEMERLEMIIKPNIGIFTNIGEAHREGFPSEEEKIRQKMRLFAHAHDLIYCRDHTGIEKEVQVWVEAERSRRVFSWSGKTSEADLFIIGIFPGKSGMTRIRGIFSEKKTAIEIPFSDAASIENAIHCWAVMLFLGMPMAKIRARMHKLEPVEMRLELKAGINRCTIINDTYNSDLASLAIALQFAASQKPSEGFTVVLSDILQSGTPQRELYRRVANYLSEYGTTRLIGIGTDIPVIRDFLSEKITFSFFPDTDAFLLAFRTANFHDELVLIKGARVFEFERIAMRLEQKAHKTVLEVNLAALVHNLNIYTRLLRPGVKVLAMVKASAYGSGAAQVARLLEFHQVDYLGVAYPDEGIELREAGVQLPILVLNSEPGSFEALLRYKLEPEIYSAGLLEELIRFVGKTKSLSIHIKLDTGMHRLGFTESELDGLIDRLKAYPNLQVCSIFSHLTSSDRADHDDFTYWQGEQFRVMSAQLIAGLGYRPLRHLVNTGGIARFPELHFDMVRLGIGLYGIDSSGLQGQLQVVNTLKATVSQVKTLMPGESVGYNRNGAVHRPSRIATISIGYADGFLRLAGNGRYQVAINGHLAPTIGNVCMDMTMIDVTGLPEVCEGDEVIVFGDHPAVQSLALALQTIAYEVFTNISDRVKRVYWQP